MFHDNFYIVGWMPTITWDEEEDEEEVTHNDVDRTCECGQRTGGGNPCGQCGMPLCPMCYEGGGGFCSKHPDEDFEGY